MVAIFAVQPLTLQDYPGKTAAIVFLAGCNFRCHYCHNPAAVTGVGKVSEKEFFEFLQSRQGKLQGVVVSGGEPTIHMDLPLFLDHIKQLGFQVKLDTNGGNPDLLRYLIERQLVDYVAMDVKAAPANYARLVQRKGFAPKIRASIRLLQKSQVEYEFRTTVHPTLTKKDFTTIAQLIPNAPHYFLQHYVEETTLNPQQHLANYSLAALEKLKTDLQPSIPSVQVR